MKKARKRNVGTVASQDTLEQNVGPKEVDNISQASLEAAEAKEDAADVAAEVSTA